MLTVNIKKNFNKVILWTFGDIIFFNYFYVKKIIMMYIDIVL